MKTAMQFIDGTDFEIDADRVYIRDAEAPTGTINPTHPYVIGHEFGPVAVVWARGEQDALDAACDADLTGSFAYDGEITTDPESGEETSENGELITGLGNASEPHVFGSYAWIRRAAPLEEQPIRTALLIARRIGEGEDFLE